MSPRLPRYSAPDDRPDHHDRGAGRDERVARARELAVFEFLFDENRDSLAREHAGVRHGWILQCHNRSVNRLADEHSPYLLQHAANPVDWFPWGDEAFARARLRAQADFPLHRLLDVPLVPRDGARVVRERRGRRGAERAVRLDQGRSGGAARRGSRVHDVRAGDDRVGRLADERVADAGSQAVLRRHLLSAGVALGPARLRRHPRRDRARVGQRTREGPGIGRRADRAAARRRAARAGGRPAGRARPRTDGGVVPRGVRPRERRVRHRAEVSAPLRAAVPVPRARARRQHRRARHRAGDARRDGRRRHARSHRRRVPSLLGGRRVARAAFREDAVRPGAARARVPRRRAGVRRPVLRRRRRGHAAGTSCAR